MRRQRRPTPKAFLLSSPLPDWIPPGSIDCRIELGERGIPAVGFKQTLSGDYIGGFEEKANRLSILGWAENLEAAGLVCEIPGRANSSNVYIAEIVLSPEFVAPWRLKEYGWTKGRLTRILEEREWLLNRIKEVLENGILDPDGIRELQLEAAEEAFPDFESDFLEAIRKTYNFVDESLEPIREDLSALRGFGEASGREVWVFESLAPHFECELAAAEIPIEAIALSLTARGKASVPVQWMDGDYRISEVLPRFSAWHVSDGSPEVWRLVGALEDPETLEASSLLVLSRIVEEVGSLDLSYHGLRTRILETDGHYRIAKNTSLVPATATPLLPFEQ